MNASSNMTLTSMQQPISTNPDVFGILQDCTALLKNPQMLREFIQLEGYVYLKDVLDTTTITAAHQIMAQRLSERGHIDLAHPITDCIALPQSEVQFMPDLSEGNVPLHELLYEGAMIHIFETLLEGHVRHFDFTWVRAVAPKRGTPPHMDIVYMGRGTKKLYTAWTPMCDIPISMGGLLVLERSHIHQRLNEGYGAKDVDEYCENKVGTEYEDMGGGGNIRTGGWLSNNPVKLRAALGGRWLTADFTAGDVLIFNAYTVHTSLDNASNRIRLSTDTRYQRADEPIDERWVGAHPIGHGKAGKKGKIC